MFNRIFYLCFLPLVLFFLCTAPMALALEREKNLPDNSGLCPPASGGGNYAAGVKSAAPSIQDVWMQHGGARLYYSAQYAPRQQYTGGASRIDPACLPLLPPIRAWGAPEPKKRSYARRAAAKTTVPCPEGIKPANVSSKPAHSVNNAKAVKDSVGGKQTGQVTSGASLSRAEAIARAKAASDAEAVRLAKLSKKSVPPKAAPEKVLH